MHQQLFSRYGGDAYDLSWQSWQERQSKTIFEREVNFMKKSKRITIKVAKNTKT